MKQRKVLMRAIPALVASLVSGYASASAFALIEQSGSGMGNAFAGAAAAAEDASTIYFNPAGMAELPAGKQVVVGLHAIDPSAKFRDTASQPGGGAKPGPLPNPFSYSGLGGDAGSLAFVPNFYFAMNVDPKWAVGIGINAPFGLKSEYDDMWIGRFQGIKSELSTVNINPTVSYKLDEKLSLGFGLNYQRIEAELTKAVNYTALMGATTNPGAVQAAAIATGTLHPEGRSDMKGDDTAWGYNLGLIYKPTEKTRIGLAYRSAIKYHLTGTLTVARPVTGNFNADNFINTNPSTLDQNISIDIKMPDSFSASVMQSLDDKWDLLGDITWTGWSKIQEIRIKLASGAADDVTNWKLHNTLRYSLGANYKYADNLKLRFGVAFDESPVPDQYRTVRLPDQNRTWLSVGMQYKPSKQSTVDVGFSYLFVKDASINNNGEYPATALGYPRGLMNGTYDSSIRLLSAQYSYNF